jgi:hypothetical protein
MLGHMVPLRTNVSEERITFIIRVTRILVIFVRSVLRLLVTANVVPNSPIHVTLMMEAIQPSETSVLTRAIRSNISEDAILQYKF